MLKRYLFIIALGLTSQVQSEEIYWSDSAGWDEPGTYNTIQTPDLNGDGKADVCGRSPEGIVCHLSVASAETAIANWGPAIQGPGWTSSWSREQYSSTIQFPDINGDGLDDLCARAAKGIICRPSNGNGFGAEIAGPTWADSGGWGLAKYYSTIQFPDLNGDGLDDLCARAAAGIVCHLSNGSGFAGTIKGPTWADSGGWGLAKYYSTIEFPDINGDGLDDVCARRAAGIVCVLSNGIGFSGTISGPAWADSVGWGGAKYYETIQYPDINGDNKQDVCARSYVGIWCFLSSGYGFTNINVGGPTWAGTSAWGLERFYASINFADVNGDGATDVLARGSARISTVMRAPATNYKNSGQKILLGAMGAANPIVAYVSQPPRQDGNDVIIGGAGSTITFDSPFDYTEALKLYDAELRAPNQVLGASIYYNVVGDFAPLPLPSLGGLENIIPYSDDYSLKVVAGDRLNSYEIPLAAKRTYLYFSPPGNDQLQGTSWSSVNNAVVVDPSDPSLFFNLNVAALGDFTNGSGIEIDLVDAGFGYSHNTLIPFNRDVIWQEADGGLTDRQSYDFDGDLWLKGSMDLKAIPVELEGRMVVNLDPTSDKVPVDNGGDVVLGGNVNIKAKPAGIKWLSLELAHATVVGHVGTGSSQICYAATPAGSDSFWTSGFSYLNIFELNKVAGCVSSVLADNTFKAKGNIDLLGYKVANATITASPTMLKLAGKLKVLSQTFSVTGGVYDDALRLNGNVSTSINLQLVKASGTISLTVVNQNVGARFNGTVRLGYTDEVCDWLGSIWSGFGWVCKTVVNFGSSISVNQSISLPDGTITVQGVTIKVL